MLHHTRISIGSDDVTMLRLQLFFFHTLRLRHIHVNIYGLLMGVGIHVQVQHHQCFLS